MDPFTVFFPQFCRRRSGPSGYRQRHYPLPWTFCCPPLAPKVPLFWSEIFFLPSLSRCSCRTSFIFFMCPSFYFSSTLFSHSAFFQRRPTRYLSPPFGRLDGKPTTSTVIQIVGLGRAPPLYGLLFDFLPLLPDMRHPRSPFYPFTFL